MILECRQVSKNYPQASGVLEVVKKIDLQLTKGQSLAIVGPSGSGKTTLLTMMAGLERPSSGQVFLALQDLSQLQNRDLTLYRAKNTGIIFQQFHLMPQLTALENVSLPLELQHIANPITKAKEALKLVGLEQRTNHFPHQLSGGECQRVAMARAFVIEPQVLFADEPTGNLDYETGEKVANLLFSAVKEKQMTLVLVTHDLELAKRCDRTVLIKNGEIQ